MLERGYQKELTVGTIASAGTLGILIPPSIMLVIMGDLLAVSVGTLFAAAVIPGLILSGIYLVYIGVLSFLKPKLAPPLPADVGPKTSAEFWTMIGKSFFPAHAAHHARPRLDLRRLGDADRGGGRGLRGAIFLAWMNGRLSVKIMREVIESAALTNALVFFIFFGATLFSFVFRALGGDEIVTEVLRRPGSTPVGRS